MTSRHLSLLTITEAPFNAETPLPALQEPITPGEVVYVRNHFDVPDADGDSWIVEVAGSVGRPGGWTIGELKSLPAASVTMVLECAGNGRSSMHPQPEGTPWGYGAVSVVEFTGAPLSGLLERVDLLEGANELVFEGADRGEVEPGRIEAFARSLPLERALNADCLLAWEMNGHPLTPEHGRPLRLVVPGWYGMASVKWLKKITVGSQEFRGFFQSEHYVYAEEVGTKEGEPVSTIRVRSLILVPPSGQEIGVGEVEISGLAWSDGAEIVRVEVSADGGTTWMDAHVHPRSSSYGPQGWRVSWTPDRPGMYRLHSRAWDSRGETQPLVDRWNRLGYGNNGLHRVEVRVS